MRMSHFSVWLLFFSFDWNVLDDLFPVGSRVQPKVDEQGDSHHFLHRCDDRCSAVWVSQWPVRVKNRCSSLTNVSRRAWSSVRTRLHSKVCIDVQNKCSREVCGGNIKVADAALPQHRLLSRWKRQNKKASLLSTSPLHHHVKCLHTP